jgi:Stf0 sulphotransferase
LRGIVARHPKIAALGEVFHSDSVDHPHNFFNYYLNEVKSNSSLALPSPSNRIALFSGFLDHVAANLHQKSMGKEWFFVGVNYNSLHSLNPYWQNFFEVPYLLNIIRWKGYFVVHLIRRNVVEATISEVRAKASGVWHIKAGEERPAAADQKILLNAKDLLGQLRARALEIDLIDRSMEEYARCLTLEYEKFFDIEGKPIPEEVAKLTKFLKLEHPIEPIAGYRKTGSVHLRDAIENYEEIAATLEGSEFAAMLDPRLSDGD